MYSREIDGEVLTLSASGWTYDLTFVLYDYESESLWYHLEGEDALTCVNGRWRDRKLPELGTTVLRWRDWKATHPNSKYLDY